MNPFSEKDPLSLVGEKALIARICAAFGASAPKAPVRPGRRLRPNPRRRARRGRHACHFRRRDTRAAFRRFDRPAPRGEKARKPQRKRHRRNGRPVRRSPLASGIVSGDLSLGWLDEFCAGVSEAAEKLGIKIVGGDVARAEGRFFSMHMSLLGTAPERTLLRSGARIGRRPLRHGRTRVVLRERQASGF